MNLCTHVTGFPGRGSVNCRKIVRIPNCWHSSSAYGNSIFPGKCRNIRVYLKFYHDHFYPCPFQLLTFHSTLYTSSLTFIINFLDLDVLHWCPDVCGPLLWWQLYSHFSETGSLNTDLQEIIIF